MKYLDKHNQLFYNGKSLADFGVTISGPGVYNAPAWDIERVTVPGRHGDLLIPHERLEMIEVTYHGVMISDNIPGQVQDLRDYLYRVGSLGLKEIRDTYNTGTYRLGIFQGPLNIEPAAMHKAAEGDLVFLCDPRRFLVSSDQSVQAGGSLVLTAPALSGGAFRSEPLITVYGTGSITLGGAEFTVTEIPISASQYSGLILDCEAMVAYDKDGVIRNDCVSPVYYWPKIQGGETIVNNTSNAIQVNARWWTV